LEFDSDFLLAVGDNAVIMIFEQKTMKKINDTTHMLYASEDICDIRSLPCNNFPKVAGNSLTKRFALVTSIGLYLVDITKESKGYRTNFKFNFLNQLTEKPNDSYSMKAG